MLGGLTFMSCREEGRLRGDSLELAWRGEI